MKYFAIGTAPRIRRRQAPQAMPVRHSTRSDMVQSDGLTNIVESLQRHDLLHRNARLDWRSSPVCAVAPREAGRHFACGLMDTYNKFFTIGTGFRPHSHQRPKGARVLWVFAKQPMAIISLRPGVEEISNDIPKTSVGKFNKKAVRDNLDHYLSIAEDIGARQAEISTLPVP